LQLREHKVWSLILSYFMDMDLRQCNRRSLIVLLVATCFFWYYLSLFSLCKAAWCSVCISFNTILFMEVKFLNAYQVKNLNG